MTGGRISQKTIAVVFAVLMTLSMAASGVVAVGTVSSTADDRDLQDYLEEDVEIHDDVVEEFDQADRTEEDRAIETREIVVRFSSIHPDELTGDRGDVIDTLRGHATDTQNDLLRWAADTEGVTVQNEFWIVNAVVLEVHPDAVDLDAIADRPFVTEIHPNFEYELPDYEVENQDVGPYDNDVTYGLDMHNVTDVHDMGITGDGAVIASLDTGINADHPDWEDRVTDEKFQEFDSDGNPIDSDPDDTSGHGTHVAGTAAGPVDPAGDVPQYGVAPDADVYHGKVIPGGSGTFAQIAGGMEWAVEDVEADAMGLSLGGPLDADELIEPTENAREAGTIVSASNGNNNPSTPGYYYSSFASQAINENMNPASFAIWDEVEPFDIWGDETPDYWPEEYTTPDASAAGVGVLSSYLDDGYAELSGTSMSQPHKLGTFALMVEAYGGSDDEFFEEVVEDTAVEMDDPIFGEGVLDSHAAVQQVALDQGVEGTVFDAAGEGFAGATVEVEETGFGATTEDDGFYSFLHEAGTWDITADGFGHAPLTEEVEIPDNETVTQDFELEPELDVELLDGQQSLVQTGDTISVEVTVAHVDTVTIEEVAGYEGDVELFVDGEEAEFGEPIDLDYEGWYGDIDVEVETGDVEGDIELEHTFAGLEDELVVTTGPTEVTDLDGFVFAGSDDNSLYAFEAATGDLHWEHEMGNDVRAAPVAQDGTVYAATFNGNLEAIDAASGEVEWVFDEPDSIFSDPVVSEEHGMAWVGTNDARLFGVDLETGEEVWEIDADDNVGAATNVVDGVLYVGDNAGNFWAIEAETGDIIWEDDSGGDYVGAATWSDGDVVVADRGDTAVRSYDADTGEVLWENEDPADDLWAPVVSPENGMVFAGSFDETLYAIDLETGETEWTVEANDRIIASPTVHGDSVIFADDAEGSAATVWSAEVETGEIEWEFDADEGVAGSPTVADGVVYVGAGVDRIFGPDPGFLYALDVDTGDEIWTYENDGTGVGFFGDPTYVDAGDSVGTAVTLGTNGHNDLFPAPDLDQGVTGQVTDSDGEPIEGASVSVVGEPFSDVTDENGHYNVSAEPGVVTLEVEKFGYETTTVEVDVEEGEFVEQDIMLEDTLDVELIDGQPPAIESGEDIDVLVEAANVGTLTVENIGEYEGDLTLLVNGEEYEFGTPINLGGFTGEADVVVETEEGGSGEVELQHTFASEELDATITIEDANVTETHPEDNVVLSVEEAEVGSIEAYIDYNTSLVEVTDITDLGQFDQLEIYHDEYDGRIHIAGVAADPLDSPVVADIAFNASELPPGAVTTLTLEDGSVITDEMGQEIDAALDDGVITHLEDELGDVLGDGEVTAADAQVVQRYLAGLEIPVSEERVETYGDVTQTGEVTTADVTHILQIVVDPAVEPPVPEFDEVGGDSAISLQDEIVVTTGPTEVFEELGEVAVIDDTEGYGEDWVDIIEDEVPEGIYEVDHVDSDDALEDIHAYDSYFVHGLDEANEEEWFEETDDVGTVYTSQNLGPETLDQRSDEIDDPDDVTQSTDLATYTIEAEHDIFAGIGEPGDSFDVHADSFEDGASFVGTDAEILAEAADGDHAAAIDEEREDILLTSVGFGWVAPGDHTDEGTALVGNSVEYHSLGVTAPEESTDQITVDETASPAAVAG